MKFYDSMGFESEHGIWVRRVDAAYAIDEAQMVAVTLSSKLGTAETRIAGLEAALRSIPRYAFPGAEELWRGVDELLGDVLKEPT